MIKVTIGKRVIHCHKNETILDAMIRYGEKVRFSCKKGICHTCRLQVIDGEVPAVSKQALKSLEDNSFLPCLCVPKENISIQYPLDYQFLEIKEESTFEFNEEMAEDEPLPDLELMNRLEKEDLLNVILNSFYKEVYQDKKLSPFFTKVSMERAIEKQYNFLHMIFSGEKDYIGDKPRNAHHWMVIDEALFEYRESMLERHMRIYGLEDEYIAKWKAKQHFFKNRIVKSRPWKKIIDGFLLPLDGIETEVATVGMICDQCNQMINEQDRFNYHVRLGNVYCFACSQSVNS